MRRAGAALLIAGLAALAACYRPASPTHRAAVVDRTRAPGACLLLTSPSGTALTVNSGADVLAPECRIAILSTDPKAAVFNAASTVATGRICDGGGVADNGGRHADVRETCIEAERVMPAAATPSGRPCDHQHLSIDGGQAALSPGVYCGGVSFNGAPSITFRPGVYEVRGGDLTFNGGEYRGAGVVFVFDDSSKPQFNSAVAVDLSAPAAGPYAGVLMSEAANLSPSTLAFNDARAMRLDGALDLPSRDVVFNSGSQLTGAHTRAVFHTLTLDQTRWRLGPAAPPPPVSGPGA